MKKILIYKFNFNSQAQDIGCPASKTDNNAALYCLQGLFFKFCPALAHLMRLPNTLSNRRFFLEEICFHLWRIFNSDCVALNENKLQTNTSGHPMGTFTRLKIAHIKGLQSARLKNPVLLLLRSVQKVHNNLISKELGSKAGKKPRKT